MILIPRIMPYIISSAAVVGKKEHDGPLGEYFDAHDESDMFGEETFELAEGECSRRALNFALAKIKEAPDSLDAVLAGDLQNQCVGTTYGLLDFDVPFLGLFGACSTIAEGLLLSSLLISSGSLRRVAVLASSHNSAAERQFRTPLEYGAQRTPTAQWTVTGAGAYILSDTRPCEKFAPRITAAAIGRTLDAGIDDANNMGAAMAPAAADTLFRYFTESGEAPSDFDLILTGDLGNEGSGILTDLLLPEGIDISSVHDDCGKMIFDGCAQDTHAGGSGCGCSASVLGTYIMRKLLSGEYKKILFIATGALMSPTSVQQGKSIAGIAHLVKIEAEER